MVAGGVTRTHEFREGGLDGVDLMRQAEATLPPERRQHMTPVVLGRPGNVSTRPAGEEAAFFRRFDQLMARCDGLGLSAISDGDPAWNLEVARAARRAGKVVEVHASEEVREPVDTILQAGASQVVHMTCGAPEDFEALAENRVSVAVCTRSNEFFGLKAPLAAMVRAGVEFRIGTDNAFLGAPDMFAEARAFARVHKAAAGLRPMEILAAMLRRQGINEGGPIAPREGTRPDVLLLDIQTERPDRDIIARGSRENVIAVVGDQGVSNA
jgi:cytosine/adenosine deaminase-related metal-dependent hydrolase